MGKGVEVDGFRVNSKFRVKLKMREVLRKGL